MKYRKEIDGLRALAVIPILFFHAAPSLIPGGFLGVDIFFVISGYLITTLILDESEKGVFQFSKFYERRARRILPALFTVMIVCAIAGLALFLPDNLENLGQSMVATTLFCNNVLLYITTGYWNLEAEFKPLIHTWSLGVEEQFYLFAPIILLLVKRSRLTIVLGLVVVCSFAFSHIYWSHSPEFSFLMILSRAWELGVGALATQIPRPRRGALTGGVGLAMIFASFWIVGPEARHPGFPTLLPVVGTVLTILGANSINWVGRLLGLRPIVFIGLISYSVYLWHQPMLAFARIVSLQEPSQGFLLFIALLSILPAVLSYYIIERPFRNPVRISRKKLIAILSSTGMVVLVAGILLHLSSGHVGSKPTWASANWNTSTNASYNEEPIQYRSNAFTTEKKKILFIGDSYARDAVNMAREAGIDQIAEFVLWDTLDFCSDSLTLAQSAVIEKSNLVLVSFIGIGSHLQCLADKTSDAQELLFAKAYFLESKSFGWSIDAVMLLPELSRYTYRATMLPWIVKENELARTFVSKDQWIDFSTLLHQTPNTLPAFTPSGKLISLDKRHLTQSGAQYFGQALFQLPQIQQALGN